MTFRQTAVTDGDYPAPFALSSPITINITNDGIAEGVEYLQAQVVETSDQFRVRIGQDTVNVTITDSKSYFSLYTYVGRIIHHPRIFAPIDVVPCIQYEEEWYRVQEEAGHVTLALVLKGSTSVPVTVTVRTLGLQDSSAEATGKLIVVICF